jgi:spore germination protein YaaH
MSKAIHRARKLARRGVILGLLVGVPVTGAALSAPGASAASGSSHSSQGAGCTGRAARALHLVRLTATRSRLSWVAPKLAAGHAHLVYRVQRAGRTIGQTTHDSIVLRVTPGRVLSYTVQVLKAGSGRSCSSTLHGALGLRTPGQVGGLGILSHTATGVVLVWNAAGRGDAPLAGYRIERDGAVVGQTRGLTFALALSGGRSHRIEVLAVDTLGHLGPASRPLLIAAGSTGALAHPTASHSFSQPGSATEPASPAPGAQTPPSPAHAAPVAPTLLQATSVTDSSASLSWNAGAVTGATLVGYELFEDGVAVGVEHGQSATVALASQREYSFSVRTLDSSGALSAGAAEVSVVTTHTPPSVPAALTVGSITSQSATVRWSPSAAVSGNIVGYRVFRDEIPVGQTTTPEMTLEDLAPSSEYEITVTAVDSLGAISAPTAPLTIRTAEPTPTHGNVQAFLLSSTDESFEDLQAHYQQVGVVYPTYFSCGADGEVEGKNDPLVTAWALARKLEVMPRVNCQNVLEEERILNEIPTREKLIGELLALCQADGYQGVQIDFEGAQPSERGAFTAFITVLAERLHAIGRKLSTTVTAKYYNIQSGRAAMFDDAALSGPSDYIVVLDWGRHWTTSAPGSIDEYAWFKRVAEYTATLPNKSKFVLGMPMYGIDWADGGGINHPGTPLEFANIVALEHELGITPEWEASALSPHFSYTDSEGVHHEVWYTDQQSIGARAELARSLGLGVGLWRLGTEDQSVWDLPQLGGGA